MERQRGGWEGALIGDEVGVLPGGIRVIVTARGFGFQFKPDWRPVETVIPQGEICVKERDGSCWEAALCCSTRAEALRSPILRRCTHWAPHPKGWRAWEEVWLEWSPDFRT